MHNNPSNRASDISKYSAKEDAVPRTFYARLGKRAIDICLSLLAIIILSPILGLLAILVLIKHGRPVLFCPTRPGKDERLFRLYKFRTMTNAVDNDGVLLPEKQRITKLGKVLRSSSLDELPELFNIIKGDMSIVGPRPLPMKYLPYYSDGQRLRHSVRPGLTGLAQISGRNNVSWPLRFDIDLEYTRQLSFRIDLAIVFKTVFKVFRSADVVVPGNTTFYQFDTFHTIEEEKAPHPMGSFPSWREIGGFFWLDETHEFMVGKKSLDWLPQVQDSALTFSGRTAIDLALEDILSSHKIRRAGIPSYCSFAMLQSFVKRNIPYSFYDVTLEEGAFDYDIDRFNEYDVLLIMPYFCLNRVNMDKAIRQAKECGCIVIEDITHSLLNVANRCEDSDYFVASLRKWFPMPAGGWLGKQRGSLSARPCHDGADAAKEVTNAMREKYQYMLGKTDEKERSLVGFVSLESDLVQVDSKIDLDDLSKRCLAWQDIDSIRRQRQENAKALWEGLKDCPGIVLLYSKQALDEIIPLYFPILVETPKRSSLQEYLREQGVYCPVTWPESMGARKSIRSQELSLICDQRYTARDMEAVAMLIRQWYAEHKQDARGINE